MEVEVSISRVALDPITKTPSLVLKTNDGVNELKIGIAFPEAVSIVTALKEICLKRPMTHDLTKNLVDRLGGTLEKVSVVDFKENIYYARLYVCVKVAGCTLEVDSRPSDAIALALRYKCPIYVDEKIFQQRELESEETRKIATICVDEFLDDLLKMDETDMNKA